ncbi:MAG: hypothetical protein LRZ84_14665 [Desertifilum sp.]|nr:hypothetical protein [Desertifilum sp.]
MIRSWIVNFLETGGYQAYSFKFLKEVISGNRPDHDLIIEAASELECPPERLIDICDRLLPEPEKLEEIENDTINH